MVVGESTARPRSFRLGSFVDATHATYALKVALAAVLTLLTAFLFDLQNTYWALLTIPLVVRPQVGTMAWRGIARLAGTLVGAIVGILLVGHFAQSAGAMIAALALWIFAAGYLSRLEGGIDAYAYAVAATTALLIAIDTGADVTSVYGFALARATETAIAILASFVVLFVVFPVSQANQARAKIAELVSITLSQAQDELLNESQATANDRQAIFVGLLSAQTDLRAMAFERSGRDDDLPRLAAVASALPRLLVAADAAGLAFGRLSPEALGGTIETARALLADLIAKADGPREAWQLSQEVAGLEALLGALDKQTSDLRLNGQAGDELILSQAGALLRLRNLAEALKDLQYRRAALADPTLPAAPVRLFNARYKDHRAAFEAGLRPMITFLASAGVWIYSGWSAGGTFTLLTTTLTMVLPTIVPRAALPGSGPWIGLGYAAGAVIALVLMVVLPALDSFTAFAVVIGATIFVIFYLTGTPQTLSVGIGATLMLAIGLQPTNEPSYSFIRLINTVATLAPMPLVYLASVTILFPQNSDWLKRHMRRGLQNCLSKARGGAIIEADFLAQGLDILGDYGGDLAASDPETQRLFLNGRAVLIAGTEFLTMWRLVRSRAISLNLAEHVPAMLETLQIGVGSGPAPSPPADVFDRVRAEVRVSLGEASGDDKTNILRFAAGCEMVRSLVLSGALAAPADSRPDWEGFH